MNYGLIEQKEVAVKDWRFGGLSGAVKTVLKADGQYTDYLPDKEYQAGLYFDSLGCVSFSALNCLETINNIKGIKSNYSDRFTARMSGTTKKGNTFKNVAESIRKAGVLDEGLWPFPRTQRTPIFDWPDFYVNVPDELKMIALNWTTCHDVDWEWVDTTLLKDALVYGPVQVGVYAWPKPQKNGLFTDGGNQRRNHAVELVGYQEGDYWTIFDSYDKTLKNLVWSYDFKSGLQFSVNKITNSQTPMPTIQLPDDVLVQEVEVSGTFGLHLNGKIIIGDEGKLLATWLMRNNGHVIDKSFALKQSDWASFPKTDLKNNPI